MGHHHRTLTTHQFQFGPLLAWRRVVRLGAADAN